MHPTIRPDRTAGRVDLPARNSLPQCAVAHSHAYVEVMLHLRSAQPGTSSTNSMLQTTLSRESGLQRERTQGKPHCWWVEREEGITLC